MVSLIPVDAQAEAPKFKLTPEQEEIIRFIRDGSGNLGVIARAGAGKTSTLVEMAKAMHEDSALCLAFNKAIATEMQERLPETCTALTLNALGHRAWGFALRTRLQLDTNKVRQLMQEELKRVPNSERVGWTSETVQDIEKAIHTGKAHGFLPSDIPGVDPIYTEDTFFETIDVILPPRAQEVVIDVSRASWNEALQGKIDFNDQILCPTLYRDAGFKSYSITFVDEAQDLSLLNHRMIEQVVKSNRLVIVGDPFQAIYAFRGANEDSMYILMEKFQMAERKLTVSFRCDEAIIENVHWRAPDMQWRTGADEGVVKTLKSWSSQDVPDGSAIICRNNGPLFTAFVSLLQAGRMPALGNKDAVYRFIKILQSLGGMGTSQEVVFGLIDRWEKKARRTNRDDDTISDTAISLQTISGMFDTLGEAIDFLQEAASRKGNIMLSTIHKSKGLEFDTVFILDVELIKHTNQTSQDPNVKYVAETRAKHTLNYISSGGFTTALERGKEVTEPEPVAPPPVAGQIKAVVISRFTGEVLESDEAIREHINRLEAEVGRLRGLVSAPSWEVA